MVKHGEVHARICCSHRASLPFQGSCFKAAHATGANAHADIASKNAGSAAPELSIRPAQACSRGICRNSGAERGAFMELVRNNAYAAANRRNSKRWRRTHRQRLPQARRPSTPFLPIVEGATAETTPPIDTQYPGGTTVAISQPRVSWYSVPHRVALRPARLPPKPMPAWSGEAVRHREGPRRHSVCSR
jgi:hypothetical protein